jgi:hypothetical protein
MAVRERDEAVERSMTRFGPYEVVEVVSLTANGSVMTAHLPGHGPQKFAIKFFKSQQTDPDEPQWDSQLFLDRARIQKSVVAAGARYWLPIHDMGSTPEGAWVATDYFALSAQKLIDARMKLTAAQLQHLVDCVVRGLVELQQARNRSFGSLKPANVIIAPGDVAHTEVFLTDPAHGAGPTEASDLYALGKLIYQLVVQKPFDATSPWPLPESEEWDQLGKTGRGWRELCNDLLVPQANSRPKLADVCWMVRDLRPHRQIRLPRRLLLGPAAAAAIILASLFTLYLLTSSARQQLARARRGWADPFVAAMQDPTRRSRLQADPDVRVAIIDLDNAQLQNISTTDSLRSNLSIAELHRARKAAAEVVQVQQDLSFAHWRRLAELISLQQSYQGRGWIQPADYLGKLIRDAQPTPGTDLAHGIDRLLRVSNLIKTDQQQAENDWQQLTNDTKQLEKTGDRVLSAFARNLRNTASVALSLADSGFGGLESLKTNAKLASRLAQALPNWPDGIDVQRLEVDTASATNLARPTRADIERYLDNLPLYSIRTTETALATATMRKRLTEVEQAVSKSNPTDEDRGGFDHGRQQVVSRIEMFGHTPFIEKELEDGSFSTRKEAIELEIQGLRRFARPESIADLVKNLAPIKTRSPKINAYWEDYKTQLATRDEARSRPNLALIKSQAQQMQSTLTGIDQEMPPVPAGLTGAFRSAAQQHREEQIGTLLASLSADSPQVDALRLASAASGQEQWSRLLQKLAADFPIRKEFLGPDDRPDEKWAQQQPGFWDDPQIQKIVKADVQRLLALRKLSGASREELVKTARAADKAEVAFGAWRELGTQRIQPIWPRGAAELSAERELRDRVSGMLGGLKDPTDRQKPQQILAEQGPIRWRNVAENASGEKTLAAVWEARQSFGIDAGQINSLSPLTRYNLWLWRTHESLAANDEASLRQSVDELTRAASEVKDPRAAALAAALSAPSEKTPTTDQPLGDRAQVALLGAQPPVEFKRVDLPGGKPFYLCTTEVSLGEFVAVVEAAHAWETCRRLPWAYQPGQPDPRRGPRVWEWSAGGLAPPQLWLATDEDNDFAPQLRAERFNRMLLSNAAGGMPSADHPMQQLSAQTALWFAAMCGCRLPTPAEWQAAYQQYEKVDSPQQCNLRDLTWELQRQYASSGKLGAPTTLWPYDDVFQPEGDTRVSMINDMRTRGTNDGALLFRPVGVEGGSVFHHLIGNVAEFLCSEPARFDEMRRQNSLSGLAAFVREYATSLYVIGGSALSPPNVPVDKPLPVSRADQSYSDVGFRLAFTAPPRSLAEKVKWAIAGNSYLWPIEK